MLPNARLSFTRNASYRDSLRLGWRHGIFLAPESLLLTMKAPVMTLLAGLALVPLTLAVWVGTKAMIIGAGLLGYLNVEVEK